MELPKQKSSPVQDIKKYIFQIYGEPKTGKSTFASKFPNALFICTEPGHKFLSVYGGDQVHKNWQEIRDTVSRLCKEDHPFETIVFDTADNAFDMCSKFVCDRKGIEHESDEDFGKGWNAVKKEFKGVIDALANRGFGIVFISHVKEAQRESKGIKRTFIRNTLGSSATKYVNGLCDFIFYAFMDDDGKRWLRTKATLNIDAGDRSGILPELVPLDFDELVNELNKKWEAK